jgi:hypothetical protein
MGTEIKKFKEWLAPLPEEDYLRMVYFGKLKVLPKKGDVGNKDDKTRLEEMINEIWKVSMDWNSKHAISGHLAYTNEHHVAQLIEGKADEINSLFAKIQKDPRVSVYKCFKGKLKTMNNCWNMSMCYSFQITTEQYRLVANDDVTPQQMFNSMKNTCEIRHEGWKLNEFYKTMVETFLLKYISIEEKVKFKRC